MDYDHDMIKPLKRILTWGLDPFRAVEDLLLRVSILTAVFGFLGQPRPVGVSIPNGFLR